MSVFKLPLRDFAAIAATIKYNGQLREKFLDLQEIGALSLLKMYPVSEPDLDHKILCWIERLYIANTLAYCYQYSEPINIKRLEAQELEGELLSLDKLYSLLRSLRYNLHTNAGSCFLGARDYQKLSRYIELIDDLIKMKVEA